ncbi:MAG: DUF1549 domain-containing protein [Planctomycetes bacterium]|nr:DUF1549 domain-containing protein [Planctomycetota bacterium]
MAHYFPRRGVQSFCLVLALLGGQVYAEGPAWTSLTVYPPQISLATSNDYQNIVVVATRADGITADVTSEAELTLPEGSPAKLEGATLRPQADGETKLVAKFGGLETSVAVAVARATEKRPVSYMLDVMPVFTRTGCNTGSCHGAASGKDGFRISLVGSDPAGDYFRLTREQATRRINLAVPVDSLLLEKACGAVTHTGGKRLETGGKYYEFIRQWLANGAVSDTDKAPSVAKLEIYPPAAVLEGEGTKQQFVAVATYSDNTTRDVTDLAFFSTNNDSSAPIDKNGLVTASSRGESFIMARFDVHTVGSQVLTLPADLKFTASTEKPANYIDELVAAKLNKLRLEHSPICTDEEFLRRVTIDIVGKLPTVEEYHAFLADKGADKRAKKIDQLLAKKEFSEIWAMKWAELLMVKTVLNRVEYKPMFLYANWLANKIANNVPLDEIVRDILGATGGTFSVPATNFYQGEPDTQKTAENVAQIFLGLRIQCAQCHNHLFDRWTMDDYYGFTAFFAQIGRKKGEDYRETIVFNSGGGEVKHPIGGRVMAPKFLGGEVPDVKGKDRRKIVADWITSPENPYFAPSVANRIWAHYLGVGIVDPVDDVRVSNPSSNPELFETLGKKLIEYKYDFKQLVRDICNSNTYQRSTDTNESNAGDLKNFSHASVRRIQAEMFLDSISQITETKDKFRGLPLGARAIHIADGKTSTYFLTTFGRAKRDTVCSCEVDTQPTLSQALHLVNGNAVGGKISQGKVIEKLLDAGKTPSEVLDEITIRSLCRMPTEDERTKILALVGEAERPVAELQDAYWALLNSREFLFNH